jgi:predicted restriction endonuclease
VQENAIIKRPVKKKLIGAKSHSKQMKYLRAQNYKCALTGIEFKEDLTNASIDRIEFKNKCSDCFN